MTRLLALLLLNAGPVALAQTPAAGPTAFEKTAPVAPGQVVVLDLKFASTIRVRPAADGRLRVQAQVSINQNKLNDAFTLALSQTADEVRVASDLAEDRLRQAQPGDCPGGKGGVYYGNWRAGSAPVCADIAVEVTLPAGASLRLKTISGNVDVAGLTGSVQVKSISGFVDLSWPPAQAAQLQFKTVTGEVYTDQNVAFADGQRTPKTGIGYRLQGSLGSGSGPLVQLESVSGDVFFRRSK